MSFMHVHMLKHKFRDPWIVKEYTPIPVWGTGASSAYDFFRNRMCTPTGSTVHNAHCFFKDEEHNMFKKGLYAMYDERKDGTKSPFMEHKSFYTRGADNGSTLARSWLPDHA